MHSRLLVVAYCVGGLSDQVRCGKLKSPVTRMFLCLFLVCELMCNCRKFITFLKLSLSVSGGRYTDATIVLRESMLQIMASQVLSS